MLATSLLVPGLLAALPVGLGDRGVFSSLDERVSTRAPVWAERKNAALAVDRPRRIATLLFDGEAVKAYPISPRCAGIELACLGLRDSDRNEIESLAKHAALDTAAPPSFDDADGDGIADSVDVLLGAKKTVLLRSAYKETAPKLSYPGGDVPAEMGVCTDVIVRALRNAGIDLQKAVFEDAGAAPKAYPGIRKRNPSLDHRRVRNLAVYFERHWRPITSAAKLLPGDVVLLDTFPSRPGPDHIGIVSDTAGPSGSPLVVNAWTNGFVTDEMDLLAFVPMPVAYRVPAGRELRALRLPAATRQVVLVSSDGWDASHGQLSLWEKDPQGRWRGRSPARRVTLGAAGLGWGRGLHDDAASTALGGPRKREGDGRAPAGIFRLSSATGYAPAPPPGTSLPYVQADERLRCVDDPESADYNQLRRVHPSTRPAWKSDERMLRGDEQYRFTVVVDHNRDPVVPGAGSCIFLHVWPAAGLPSPGCTMMAASDMRRLFAWLEPRAQPVLVQLPRALADQATSAWGFGKPK